MYNSVERIVMNNIVKKFRLYMLMPLVILAIFFTTNLQPQATLPNITKAVDPEQIQCLATNIFHEARKESIMGQAAVAWVVVNRVTHGFASTPCKVIYQATHTDNGKLCQFSWVCEGKGKPNKNDPLYKKAYQIAYEVLVLDMYKGIIPGSVLFFHAIHVDPMWPYHQVKQIGNHIFYAKKKPSKVHVSKE